MRKRLLLSGTIAAFLVVGVLIGVSVINGTLPYDPTLLCGEPYALIHRDGTVIAVWHTM